VGGNYDDCGRKISKEMGGKAVGKRDIKGWLHLRSIARVRGDSSHASGLLL
jgi:hypothetical protein